MNKILLSLCLASLSFSDTYCQSTDNNDSLIKYSYFINGVNYGDSSSSKILAQTQGSGFFIKYKSDTFFITARHVLDGCDDNLIKRSYVPNIMNIDIHDENGNLSFQWITIDTKDIKKTSVCRLFEMYPDLVAYKVNNINHYKIYLIQNYLPSDLPKNIGEIKIYGFPAVANYEMMGNMPAYIDKPASKLNIKKYDLYSQHVFTINTEISFSNREITHVDSFNYIINTNDIIIDYKIKGYSGSPCFIQDSISGKWVFLGIQVAINSEYDYLYIIKPKFILDELKNN